MIAVWREVNVQDTWRTFCEFMRIQLNVSRVILEKHGENMGRCNREKKSFPTGPFQDTSKPCWKGIAVTLQWKLFLQDKTIIKERKTRPIASLHCHYLFVAVWWIMRTAPWICNNEHPLPSLLTNALIQYNRQVQAIGKVLPKSCPPLMWCVLYIANAVFTKSYLNNSFSTSATATANMKRRWPCDLTNDSMHAITSHSAGNTMYKSRYRNLSETLPTVC